MKERRKIEKLWREEKYRVLFHDQNAYHSIRTLLKSPITLDEVKEHITHALTIHLQKAQLSMLLNICGGISKNNVHNMKNNIAEN